MSDISFSTTRLLSAEKPQLFQRQEDKYETILFLPEGKGRKGEGGLRTMGRFKRTYEMRSKHWYIAGTDIEAKINIDNFDTFHKLPLITVITVVYNSAEYLEQTIKSVIGQTYPNVEYIIIDGGSTDGTLDVIKRYEDKIDYWVSEKDSGVYDAMNKGIDLALGEWINFMNAGDTFYNKQVLNEIEAGGLEDRIDIIFSDTIVDGNTKFLAVANQEMKRFIHQSLIYKKKLHYKFGKYLNIEKSTISDYLFFAHVWTKENSVKTTFPISVFNVSGISSNSDSHVFQRIAVDMIFSLISPIDAVKQILTYSLRNSVRRHKIIYKIIRIIYKIIRKFLGKIIHRHKDTYVDIEGTIYPLR